MGRKAKYSKELKLEIISRYQAGESGYRLAEEYGLPRGMASQIPVWSKRYSVYGESILEERRRNKGYSKELKKQVIKEYKEGGISTQDLANKHNISTNTIVVKWVKKYNSGIEINDYIPKGDVYKMKSRKTTIEERIEIVEYVLDNDNDYKGAAEKYAVPYTNVYNWVKKYLEHGEDGLKDKRGRPSSKQEKENLSEVEKLQIEIESLKARNIRLERTIVALKKKRKSRRE